MLAYALSTSGWLALVLVAATTALPYLLRPTRLSHALGIERRAGPLTLQFRPHVVFGLLILGLGLFHASVAMELPSGALLRMDQTGLVLATLSLGFIFVQVMLGWQLLQRGLGHKRVERRRWHFWSMGVLVAVTLGQIVLNSALLHAAFHL
jgi:hypothetical protein